MQNLYLAENISSGRMAARLEMSRASTLRIARLAPIDIVIEDLSSEGCRISSPMPLKVGTSISIGIPGVGARSARVIWVDMRNAGCQFDQPVSLSDIGLVGSWEALVSADFAKRRLSPMSPECEATHRKMCVRPSSIILASISAWLLFALACTVVHFALMV